MEAVRPDFAPAPEHRIYCNRTLNMRAIKAVGFDMDYTLVHYDVEQWEACAYGHVKGRLAEQGHPVQDLRFDPHAFTRGLIVDLELGNIVKANRFGYVTRAAHGMKMMEHDAQRRAYSQVWVSLSAPRWVFLNTLFSLSEACLYAQMVELRDAGKLTGNPTYEQLYRMVSKAMDAAHLEGELKAEVVADPDRFLVEDPHLVHTLLDLKHAGKKLFLATNSEWHYTVPMMRHAIDRHLPKGTWRDLFDLVIVQAKKPRFFEENAPAFRIVDDKGTEAPHEGRLQSGNCYRGTNAQMVQEWLGVGGEDILYVGDHVYADVHVSSSIRRWRTALILRELEDEIAQEHRFAPDQQLLFQAAEQKAHMDREQALLRLTLQRMDHDLPLPPGAPASAAAITERLRMLRQVGEALDHELAALARKAGEIGNPRWGPLMRAGNDKSRLARQIERHADVYTSRVANFLHLTPFGYLRASHGTLPHDAV